VRRCANCSTSSMGCSNQASHLMSKRPLLPEGQDGIYSLFLGYVPVACCMQQFLVGAGGTRSPMPAIRARPVRSLDGHWRNPGLRRGCWRDVGVRDGLELRFSWDERAALTQPSTYWPQWRGSFPIPRPYLAPLLQYLCYEPRSVKKPRPAEEGHEPGY
jgi:hypothetical protein